MKTIFKFKFQNQEGFLSVVEESSCYYALVQKDTPKVKNIEENKKLFISYELKNPNYIEVDVKVSYNQDLIHAVYHKLEAEKNLYFKQLDDTLCVLEIPKQKK